MKFGKGVLSFLRPQAKRLAAAAAAAATIASATSRTETRGIL